MKKDISYYQSYVFFFGLILALIGLALNDRPVGLCLMGIGAVGVWLGSPLPTMSGSKKDDDPEDKK